MASADYFTDLVKPRFTKGVCKLVIVNAPDSGVLSGYQSRNRIQSFFYL